MKKNKKIELKPILFKLGGLALLILIPVLVVMAIFMPIIRSNKPLDVSTYRLPQEFAQEEIDELVGLMKHETEFGFYFELIDEENIVRASQDVYTSLRNRRSVDRMLEQVKSNQKKIKGLAMFFSSYDYSHVNWEEGGFPAEIKRAIWLFLYEDFKLTLSGLVFQKLHQPDFQFQWDEETRVAAVNLKKHISNFNESQRALLKNGL